MYAYDQAHALVKAIRELEEYKLLKKQREKINADPALIKMLTDFRRRQLDIQKLQMTGQKVPEETVKMFGHSHGAVMANPVLKEFFEAERRFGLRMNDIQKILVDGLGLH